MPALIRFCSVVGLLIAVQGVPAADCGPFEAVPPENSRLKPNHHPVGKPMPDNPMFHQPDSCGEGVWFYDANRNGLADPGELRLYGSDRAVACGSCHAESPEVRMEASMSVFLRQDTRTLCLVCHNQ